MITSAHDINVEMEFGMNALMRGLGEISSFNLYENQATSLIQAFEYSLPLDF
jgi:hypothetical protein